MEAYELVLAGYESVLQTLERVLDGLSPEDLRWQPSPDCNSIGWLAWHISRGQDGLFSIITGEEQLWTKDGWHARFGRPADPMDSGFGHTAADVASFACPDAGTLLDYYRAVLERTRAALPDIIKTELDRPVEGMPFQPPPTVGTLLTMILSDGLEHAGQAAYVRGMRQGLGWQKF